MPGCSVMHIHAGNLHRCTKIIFTEIVYHCDRKNDYHEKKIHSISMDIVFKLNSLFIHHGRDHMVIGFTTTYVIVAYHH